MHKATLVVTTIADPVILDTYHRNFEHYGHLDQVDVIVIPDKKTPAAAFETCARLRKQGLAVTCPTVEEQDAYLGGVGLPPGFILYNSDNRRNVGFLMALERDADFLISIDDDNYCSDDSDYFAEHEAAFFKRQPHTIASDESRFYNVCDLLEIDAKTVYARGYPYFARHTASKVETRQASTEIMINAGLWLQDPDVDAITWLALHPNVRSFKNQSLVLSASTWSPVNSQNTAIRWEVIPAYYYIRMGYPLHGASIDRYGDIFSGYFALACAKHLGGSARFGTPIADHRRNSHNYLRDAAAEWPGILLLEDVLAWLIDAQLSGSNGMDAYVSLSHGMEEAVENFRGAAWNDAARGFIHQMAHLMRLWIAACRRVGSRGTASLVERSVHESLGGDDRVLGNGNGARVCAAAPEPVK